MYGIIYKIINKVNNKIYIGQTVQGFDKRYSCKGDDIERVFNFNNNRKNRNTSYNSKLYNAIKKYGFSSFEVNKIFDLAFSKEELDIKEKYWIDYYKCCNRNNGYNFTCGGNEYTFSEDVKSYLKVKIKENALKGEDCHSATFTNKQIYNIKKDLFDGENPREIMDKYNISYKNLKRVIDLDAWGSVGVEYNYCITKIVIPPIAIPKIIAFDKCMNIIEEFGDIKEAVKKTKISESCIYACYSFGIHTCKNYVFLRQDENFEQNIIKKKKLLIENNIFMVGLIGSDGEILKLYNSNKEASDDLNLDGSSISKVYNGKMNMTNGYKFKKIFVDEII